MLRFLGILMSFVFILSDFNISFAQVYRNTEYQFRIEIPDYLEYKTPKGPNVKMSAAAHGGTPNMNVIVKAAPELAFTNDDFLNYLLSENLASQSNTRQLIKYGTIEIPNNKVLCSIWRVKYTYPERMFFLTGYTFEFVSNYRYYCISYFVEPGTEAKYEKMITYSIGSFVDEKGWY